MHCPAGQDYSETICDDKDNLDTIGGVSSFFISKGLTVTFFTEKNYEGSSADFSSNSDCLAQEGQWNDKFNSVKLNKPVKLAEGCLRLVRHCPQSNNYDEVHCKDLPNLNTIGGLSGIFFGPNTKATFFSGENFTGQEVIIDADVSCLNLVGPWNDRLNSFIIRRPQPLLAKGCIEIFRHCPGGDNFSKIYCDSQPQLDEIQGVSGIHFGQDTKAQFYSNKNYQGSIVNISKDVECLLNDGQWNDKINSFKLIDINGIPEGCVKLFRNCPDGDPYYEIACESRSNLDTIQGLSGYILGKGAVVDFFSERNFKGQIVHAQNQDLCLPHSGLWNDKLNSLRFTTKETSTDEC